jgi:hypothetical protein
VKCLLFLSTVSDVLTRIGVLPSTVEFRLVNELTPIEEDGEKQMEL